MQEYVHITLDRKRRIQYDYWALSELENALGVKLIGANQGWATVEGIRGTLALLWAGLIMEDPALTIRQVSSFFPKFDAARLTETGKTCMEALVMFFGVSEEIEERPPVATAENQASGSTSGPSPDTTSDSPTPSSGS